MQSNQKCMHHYIILNMYEKLDCFPICRRGLLAGYVSSLVSSPPQIAAAYRLFLLHVFTIIYYALPTIGCRDPLPNAEIQGFNQSSALWRG